MIKKLQTRFVFLTMSALFAVLFVIITGINAVNYNSVIEDIDRLLVHLSENEGTFPEFKREPPVKNDKTPRPFDSYPSMETPYETRYFSVLLERDTGHIMEYDMAHIASVDYKNAEDYALKALQKAKTTGFIDRFRYLKNEEKGTLRIIFMDCGRILDAVRNFLLISTGIALAGFVIVTMIIIYFSNRIIRPLSESYEKQKRFITDASHELKTPLTIINADADILEMEYEDNEWITDIKKQTKRLTELTNNLMLLSRMEESEHRMQKVDFPISETVTEAALSFQALAQTQNKLLHTFIEPMLTFCGDSKGISQLTAILLDNALKYSPENSTITLTLEQKNKLIRLSVSNRTTNQLPRRNLNLLFDRFYRADSSRNSAIKGYGIGLSIAKAVVTAHNGKIKVISPTETEIQIIAQFPI
ncbi:MAG: HAMP domain-containing histidine kinase [Lachnospiraceae bacterium]|nr:HAMP domain-containing histidine kinase [Lachnospiraceae bacterium]